MQLTGGDKGKGVSLFEIVEIGPLTKPHWWTKRRFRAVKAKAITACFCEKLGRTFQGYQVFSTQTYRADFPKDAVVTIWFAESEMITAGDKLSVEALAGSGHLERYFRMVATRG
jgi:hypothetical protein